MRGAVAVLFSFLWSGVAAVASPSPLPLPQPGAAPAPPPLVYQTRYFFTIDLDPCYQVVGTGALTQEAARLSNCYSLSYDEMGRLARVEYRRADAPTPDPLFGVERIDFEYQLGLERRWYRDTRGQPVQNVANIYGEDITLNPAGCALDVANLDEEGGRARDSNGVIHYARTLDERGRVIRARRLGLLGTALLDRSGDFETRTTYDDQGRRMEYANFDDSGNLLDDREGVATIRTLYTLFPDSTQIVESYFDANRLPTEERSTGIHSRERTNDERGLILSEAYADATGAPTTDPDGVHKRQFEYDALGNLLSEGYLGIDDKLAVNKSLGYARVTYQYDAENRVREKAFFGDDGAPIVVQNLGAAMIRQSYDAQGNVVRRQFFDGLGHPSNQLQYGAPAIAIENQGGVTTISLRDAQNRPVENSVGGFAIFSYVTSSDQPLTRRNLYYNRHGRPLSAFSVFVINPHLHALRSDHVMQYSARIGAAVAGLGCFLAAWLAWRKARFTGRRQVHVPGPLDRFLSWLALLFILEGGWRFLLTIWWAYVDYRNGQIGIGVYLVEAALLAYFAYRLGRMRVTLRVLNITESEVHRLLREFFVQAQTLATWQPEKSAYVSAPLLVTLTYFRAKSHAYLALRYLQKTGGDLGQSLARHLRAVAPSLQGPPRTRAIAFYYPTLAFSYSLLGLIAFYVFYTLLTR